MLHSRKDRTRAGHKLAVEVAYPKSYVAARLVRGLTIKAALTGAVLGFVYGAFVASSGARPPLEGAALWLLAAQTLGGAFIGALAGIAGSFAYARLGGAAGALAGIAGAALVAGASVATLPTLASIPRELGAPIGESVQSALGYVPASDPNAVPVWSDSTVKEEAPPAAPLYQGPWNDRVVFLGMNPGPTKRAIASLKRSSEVTGIVPSLAPDSMVVNGKRFDLRTSRGVSGFVSTLRLNPKQAAGVRKAFTMSEKGARDELAGLAQIWARGEKGGRIPSRLVLAGHSNGDGVWGDDNGSLRLGPLLQLSRSLPHATAQIEDAFVTGCYSGGEVTMDQYLLIFPRAKTIWAYDAQAPGVDNGATVDQGGWERATRGRAFNFIPNKSAVAAKKMAVWNFKTGYHGHQPPLTLAQLRGKVQWMEGNFFRPAMAGEADTFDGQWRIPLRITDPHTGLVRQYYSWLVRLTQHKQLPEDERAYWVEKKHQTIRLLYYSATVSPKFAQHHRAQIAQGYRELGLTAPDFSRMPRAQALASVDRYIAVLERKGGNRPTAEAVGTLLERGIKDLDPSVIPDGWV